jgi:hypothetical protein
MNGTFLEMNKKCEELILLIDNELKK